MSVTPMDTKQEFYHSFCCIGNKEISHVHKMLNLIIHHLFLEGICKYNYFE